MSEKILNKLKDIIIKNNSIATEHYEKMDVKRGLRNSDGSGVRAGLTGISSVIGTKKTPDGLEPVEGDLKYRGQSLKNIVDDCKEETHHHFERVCFLLMIGKWPSDDELQAFCDYMAQHRQLPQEIIDHIIKPIPSKNIMNKLQTSISALYAFDENPDELDPMENFLKSVRLIAKLPLIVSYSYLAAYKNDPTFLVPDTSLSQAEAFLYTLKEGNHYSSFDAHIIDLALVLHAEHGGGNNSTFTTYVVSSSGSDIYSTLAAAVASLKGPLHGAANKKVMEMMADIKENVPNFSDENKISDYLSKLVKKEAGDKTGKLYGLGHAVYTKSDPRAVIIQELGKKIATTVNRSDEFELYQFIAKKGPDIFQTIKQSDKVISPNVDFYSGFVYDCLGIPQEIYTPLFAMARSAGWCAHRTEELLSGKRIIRPGYAYIAPEK